ncbi:MAG: histidine phosphatase family protein [Gammaproteobacteria bacterium]
MATKRLIMVRHAKSDWHSGARTDFDRPLNHRGRRDAPRMGRWLNVNNLCPEIVCCSSAARTRETIELVATELDLSNTNINFTRDLYHANEGDIVDLAEQQFSEYECVMLVGHNPGFEMALLHYVPDVQIPADGQLMTTCSVAVIDFDEALGVPRKLTLIV